MDEIIKITKDLIKIKSINEDFKARKKIIEYVEKYFKNTKLKIQKYLINKNPAIFICNCEIDGEFDLLLNGHLDVVDAEDKEFNPEEKNGKIYGRGAGDMKAGCAVMMKFLKDFSTENKKNKSVGLLLTTDEEIGGENGVGYLIKNQLKKTKPKIVIIPDGGKNLKTIVLNQKGILHIKVWAKGLSAHGARPFWGDNAVEKLLDIYNELKKKFPNPIKRDWKNTMNLGRFFGGKAVNKVPDKAEMFLDFRFIESGDKEIIIKKILKITKNFKILTEGEPFIQDKKNNFLLKYKKIVEKELKKIVIFDKIEGASDARHFSKNNISVIITKINCDNIHSNNEWVEIKEMKNFYNILIKFIDEI